MLLEKCSNFCLYVIYFMILTHKTQERGRNFCYNRFLKVKFVQKIDNSTMGRLFSKPSINWALDKRSIIRRLYFKPSDEWRRLNVQSGSRNRRPGSFAGRHETCISKSLGAELGQFHSECKKNPEHCNFIPIKEFNINSLPESHRDNELYQLITAISYLTVKVDVEKISIQRPEFWPNTDDPFPLSDLRGHKIRTNGTGYIVHVTIYTNGIDQYGDHHLKGYKTCTCRKCETSRKPSKIWLEIEVKTASQVVFDSDEADCTSLTLFYDSPHSKVFTLHDVCIEDSSIDNDESKLKCVTCNTEMLSKLYQMKLDLDETWKKVHEKYKTRRNEDKLAFIVSHPHGCTKHVSIGTWIDQVAIGNKKSSKQFTYTASTCPGSSGAPVYLLGYSGWGTWLDTHVHSGCTDEFNYSAVCDVYD